MKQASPTEQSYFRRVGVQNRELPEEQPPASLAEMFERLEVIRNRLGSLAQPGRQGPGGDDLKSHLEYLKRLRFVDQSRRT